VNQQPIEIYEVVTTTYLYGTGFSGKSLVAELVNKFSAIVLPAFSTPCY
jgi:hypothetical protein